MGKILQSILKLVDCIGFINMENFEILLTPQYFENKM